MIFLRKILWEGESPYNKEVKVVESSGVRRLVVQGYTQSRTLDKNGRTGFYWDSFAENLPNLTLRSKILILGLGAGTVAKVLTNKFGSMPIHGVEIDPLIVNLGKKYFYLGLPNIKVFLGDAGGFIKRSKEKYDVVCVDLFYGSNSPKYLTEPAFLKSVKKRIKGGGRIVINKICNDKCEDEEFIKAISKIFPNHLVSRGRGNVYQQNIMFYGRL